MIILVLQNTCIFNQIPNATSKAALYMYTEQKTKKKIERNFTYIFPNI